MPRVPKVKIKPEHEEILKIKKSEDRTLILDLGLRSGDCKTGKT